MTTKQQIKASKEHLNNSQLKTKRITYKTLGEVREINKIMENIKTYDRIGKVKKFFGYSLIGLGSVTFPLPTGSIFLIMGGCYLVRLSYKDVLKVVGFYFGKCYNFLYSIRNIRLIRYRLRLLKMRFFK